MQSDVLTPEVEVMDLDGQISNELKKANVTDMVIGQLKERFGSLRLRNNEDHETYLEISAARKEVRKWGVLVEKITKKGREEAIAIQKKWLSKEKEILGKIAEVQDPLDAEIKKFEDEKERKEAEIRRKQEEQFIERQSAILKYGGTFAGAYYTLGEISYEAISIKEADEEIWQEVILPKYRKVYERVEAQRVAEETARREAQEKLEAEQRAFREQQEAFAAEQAKFKQAQDELAKAQQEIERKKREEEEAQLAEKRRIQSELQQKRLTEILPYNKYGSDVDMGTLWVLAESHFQEILAGKKVAFDKAESERIEREEAQRQAAIDQAKKDAAEREIKRIADEQKAKDIAAQQEAQRLAEEAAKASDSDKWELVIKLLSEMKLPEMKSTIYKRKVAIMKEKLEEIKEL